MMNNKFSGTGVALVTPFNQNLEIDFEGLRKLLAYTADGGVDYYVVIDTTGESVTLTNDEKASILEFVKANNTNELPIVYGIGGNNTTEILEIIKKTNFSEVDAILSVSPYYNKPSQEGIFAHFSKIADASPVPVILYNVPGRTASNIAPATTLRLAAHPNIIGIKEASGDLVQCMEIAKHKPEGFSLISGDDLLTVPMAIFGATGVISVLANAFPVEFSNMIRDILYGDVADAKRLLFNFLDVNPLMYQESNPVGIKSALKLKGVCGDHVRLPLLSASKALEEQIKNAMKAI